MSFILALLQLMGHFPSRPGSVLFLFCGLRARQEIVKAGFPNCGVGSGVTGTWPGRSR